MKLNYVVAGLLIVLAHSTLCSQTLDNQKNLNNLDQSFRATGSTSTNASSYFGYGVDDDNFSPFLPSATIHKKDNCTPPTIDDFPPDPFTPEQRKEGNFSFKWFKLIELGSQST